MIKNKISWSVNSRTSLKKVSSFIGFLNGIPKFRIYAKMNDGDNKIHYVLTDERYYKNITTSYDYKELQKIANDLI